MATEGAIVEAIKKYYGAAKSLVATGTATKSVTQSKDEKKVAFNVKDYDLDEKENDDNEFVDDIDIGAEVDVEDFDNLVHGAVEEL